MKTALFALVMSLSLIGCSSTDSISSQNRQNMTGLYTGMPRQNVLASMGTNTIRSADGRLINNPYRTEIYRSPRHEFELLLYFTAENRRGDGITNDDLTPLVIMDGKLDGWGWSYWNTLVQKYELRL